MTVIEAEPNPVLAVTDKAKAGHASVQLGLGTSAPASRVEEGRGRRRRDIARRRRRSATRRRRASRPRRACCARVRLDEPGNAKAEIPTYNVGDVVKVDIFAVGDTVKVTGTSKGRGFQGVVKRYGIGGGPNTHGNTKHRRPGSIGPGTDPSRVIKGKKMPGHYGDARHTQTHLRVEKIDAERNLIYIRGSVAGPSRRHRDRAEAGLSHG